MKKLLIPAFCALAMMACTGNQKPNQSGTNNTQPVESEATVQTAESAGDKANEMADLPDSFIDFLTKLPSETDKPFFYQRDSCNLEKTTEYYYCYYDYFAYPMTSGGYMAVLMFTEVDEAEVTEWSRTYTFKIGEMHRADGILPVPELAEMLDSVKCKGNESKVKAMTSTYNKDRDAYLSYAIDPELGRLTISLMPDGPDWDVIILDLAKPTVYGWDGAQFVRIPEVNEEQLTYDILKKLSELPDSPLGKKAFDSIKWEMNIVESFEHFICDINDESEDGLVLSLNCFPYNDGGYAVMFRCELGCNCRDKTFTYNYKNGFLSPCALETFLPEPPQDIKSPVYFYSVYGKYLEINTGFYKTNKSPEIHYIWNGKKFVKE